MPEFDPSERTVFPAKLLLFGEYTVLLGSKALAIPVPKQQFYGRFTIHLERFPDSSLISWCDFLERLDLEKYQLPINLSDFRRDILSGWHFESNIPVGYGLGSSGALCAAVLWRYSDISNQVGKTEQALSHKSLLAEMESFFHEKSSGLDPLVSLYNQPVLVSAANDLKILTKDDRHLGLDHFYLLDSKQPRSTAEWVHTFHQKLKDSSEFENACKKMASIQNTCIDSWIFGDTTQLKNSIFELSQLQFQQMAEWIPQSVFAFWEKGLSNGSYAVKLCGAGGGGYFLVYKADSSIEFLPVCLKLG